MLKKKILPFSLESPIASYNYTSFIGGVLQESSQNWYPYYLSKHILLLSNDIFDVSCDDMLMYEDQNVFEDYKLSEQIKKKEDLLEKIICQIEDDFYVSVTVDEYFIPFRYSYKVKTFYHDMLIYGYDLEKKIFMTAGYDNTGNFTLREYDIELIVSSIERCVIERKSKPFFHFFKCKDLNLTFEINRVKEIFLKYKENSPILKEKYRGKYGLEAYDKIIEKFNNCYSQNMYWRKASFAMLVEHKNLMEKRLEYINNNVTSLKPELFILCKEVKKIAREVQFDSLKYEMIRKDSIRKRIEEKILLLKEEEYKLFEHLLKEI